ncbi:hypothetical protein [Empedobacter sp.]|uniref:hypothetical protein n=1 Tax=Empedobacter sp. TaxID=1927715 RepID=UPI00289A2093|nr:hypothetical protein [Empedobacter sp.]
MRKTTKSTGTNFLKENKGALKISRTQDGAYQVAFNSPVTGRTSFAYGENFKRAYNKMVFLYNLKYAN